MDGPLSLDCQPSDYTWNDTKWKNKEENIVASAKAVREHQGTEPQERSQVAVEIPQQS